MKSSPNRVTPWRAAIIGAILCAVAGLLVGYLEFGRRLALSSYDIPFAFRHARPLDDVIIVYLDETTYDRLKQHIESEMRHLLKLFG